MYLVKRIFPSALFVLSILAFEVLLGQNLIPVQIHVLREGGVIPDTVLIRQELAAVNSYVEDADLSFSTCNPVHIIETMDSDLNLRVLYNNPNQLDIFFKNSIDMEDACGYATINSPKSEVTEGLFTIGGGAVFVMNTCIDKYVLAHEIGHYMGLLHTHDNQIPELADGSNCATAGDKFCDTPADPNIRNEVNSSCVYTGVRIDANSQPYSPDVSNLMSYSRHSCKTGFSAEQLSAMRQTFESYVAGRYMCDPKPNLYLVNDYLFPLYTLNRDYSRNYKFAIQNNTNLPYDGNVSCRISYRDKLTGYWIEIKTETILCSLTKFDTDTFTIALQAVPAMLDGPHDLRMEIDYDNLIAESVENDNLNQLVVTVAGLTSAQPDFEISAITPATASLGIPIEVKYRATNIGTANSNETTMSVKISLSRDSIKSIDDLNFTIFYSGANFNMNIDNFKTERIALYNEIGVQYLIMEINSVYTEITKGNNKVVIPIEVIDSPVDQDVLPDFTISNYSISNSPVAVYDIINGHFDVVNQNYTPKYNYTNVYYVPTGYILSLDNNLSQDDVFLGTSLVTNFAGSTVAGNSLNALVTQRVTPGAYYLFASLDYYNMLKEKDESNNIASAMVTITDGATGDLVITGIRTNKNSYVQGESITYEIDIKNQGYATVSDFYVIIDLKSNSYFNSSSYTLTGSYQTSLAAGSTLTLSATKTISTSLPDGIYFVVPGITLFSGGEYTTNNSRFTQHPVTIGNVTSIQDGQGEDERLMEVFPNPVKDEAFIRTSAPIDQIRIASINGSEIRKVDFRTAGDFVMIDTKGLDSGLYFLIINSGNKIVRKKLVVE